MVQPSNYSCGRKKKRSTNRVNGSCKGVSSQLNKGGERLLDSRSWCCTCQADSCLTIPPAPPPIMAPQAYYGRPQGSTNVLLLMRAVIIGLRLLAGFEFTQIKRKTGVPATTAQHVYVHAEDASQPAIHDIHKLLKHIDDRPRSGRPPKIASGSAESAAIRDSILKNGLECFKDAAVPVLKELGIMLVRSMVEHIAHNHRDLIHPFEIVRGKAPLKAVLSEDNKA